MPSELNAGDSHSFFPAAMAGEAKVAGLLKFRRHTTTEEIKKAEVLLTNVQACQAAVQVPRST